MRASLAGHCKCLLLKTPYHRGVRRGRRARWSFLCGLGVLRGERLLDRTVRIVRGLTPDAARRSAASGWRATPARRTPADRRRAARPTPRRTRSDRTSTRSRSAAPAAWPRRRCREAEGDADQEQSRAGLDDHPPDRSRIGPERDAHANLPRLLRDGVGHHAVDADDRQDQPQRGEDREQDDVETRPGVDELVEERLDRPDFGDRLIAIDRVDAFDDRARDARPGRRPSAPRPDSRRRAANTECRSPAGAHR